jgi:hypothetical protein
MCRFVPTRIRRGVLGAMGLLACVALMLVAVSAVPASASAGDVASDDAPIFFLDGRTLKPLEVQD